MTFGWDETVTGLSKLPPPYVPTRARRGAVDVPAPVTGMVPAVRLGVPRQVTCTVRHTVYIPDATTITTNAKVALASGWSGITMWTFGYETSDVYDAAHLGGIAPQRATGALGLALDSVTRTTTTVTVKGATYNPQFDLPVPVQISFRPRTAPPSVRHATAVANRPAATRACPPRSGRSTATSASVGIPTGATTVCVTQLAWGGTPIADDDSAARPFRLPELRLRPPTTSALPSGNRS